ncbi:ABC transporter ATP-binding protein [Gallintestinimicrobium propionicum]|uniref:ABC transporter ATP-binding protein/permease n=1 Tax=Gallintestinimicrobium propionicum TaxID=2981770 RepID=A0AAE3AY73_9FIRM|nr:ABC transporter ATP-binding protein [Gallintestinimicrobium propionicum]MCC2168084.1 ABC transporter ATP-binding protein/permease [Gallintestinimicrobium propionicum]
MRERLKKTMPSKAHHEILTAVGSICTQNLLLPIALVITVVGAVVTALVPPLILEKIVDGLTAGNPMPIVQAFSYFGVTALAGLLESTRESLLIVFGQKLTHGLRSQMCEKLSQLSADTLSKMDAGTIASRFVGDVDTLETLFTSGIISMFADACTMIGIYAVLWQKNRGLAITLLAILPLIALFTRHVQKKMLAAQMDSRKAAARTSGLVPETIHCIRMIHVFGKEGFMRKRYDRTLQEGYAAMERTNFYDALYSPVILITDALVTGVVMLLSASAGPEVRMFFGMSVGTAVAVISYISRIFSPIESIGMEIQTIQEALAGAKRVGEFLELPTRLETSGEAGEKVMTELGKASAGTDSPVACISLEDVSFGYEEEKMVLEHLSFEIKTGEQVTMTGRTGAGKSTVFKLLLGLYRPQKGCVKIYGQDAYLLPDSIRRCLFGCVEQSFKRVPGTVLEQITLSDPMISREDAVEAAKLAGLHEVIAGMEQGYDTPCTDALFSQGQWQLLSIARAVAAKPSILLLDEITANLDVGTEQEVLYALRRAGENRTVVSISHRLYEKMGGRELVIG